MCRKQCEESLGQGRGWPWGLLRGAVKILIISGRDVRYDVMFSLFPRLVLLDLTVVSLWGGGVLMLLLKIFT